MRALHLFALLPLLATGCAAEVHAKLVADGTPFEVRRCLAGEPLGFFGVELLAFDGRRLRLVTRSDGAAEAVLFAADKPVGASLGACGPFTYRRAGTEVNHVEAVDGSATLSCRAGAHAVEGTIRFEGCAG